MDGPATWSWWSWWSGEMKGEGEHSGLPQMEGAWQAVVW